MHRWNKLRIGLGALVIVAALVAATAVFAQDEGPPTEDIVMSLNMLWVMVAGALVFLMQAGFALVETGFTRNKNTAHTMMMNVMVFCIGAIGYWLTGFALEFGGINYTFPQISAALPAWAFSPTTLGTWTNAAGVALLDKPLLIGGSGFMGLTGFMMGGLGANVGVLVFFFFQMVFMDTAATIPTGTMAERFKFVGFALMGLWVSMFIYPLIGNWVWGGGWLANLGRSMGWGNGAVDFAGSGVVHTVGGAIALAGGIMIGPRIGKYNKDGSANSIPGHNIPMGALGCIILFFGWLGFNPGSSLGFFGGARNLSVLAAANTLMAGAAGGCVAMLYMWIFGPSKKPDPGMSLNGLLAGLVMITAPCAFVDMTSAVIIGCISGVTICWAVTLLDKFKIDDPVGAIPVHLVHGVLGLLAVGIFANGNPDSAMWNGVATPVTGLLFGGGIGQFLAQFTDAIATVVVVTGTSLGFFWVLKKFNLLRVSAAVELGGLDMPEMGAEGYPKDWEPSAEAIAPHLPHGKGVPVAAPAAAGD